MRIVERLSRATRGLWIVSFIALAGCATQHQVEESRLVGGEEKIESLVVFVISSSTEERASMENIISRTMSELGVPTQPTYPRLPSLDDLGNDQAIIDMYRNTGANMGLTIESLEGRSERAQKAQVALFGTWLAGLVLDEPALRSAGAWGGLAAYSEAGKYKLRVSLWDAADGELQWTMDTDSFTNDRPGKDAEELAAAIHAQLQAKGLLQ